MNIDKLEYPQCPAEMREFLFFLEELGVELKNGISRIEPILHERNSLHVIIDGDSHSWCTLTFDSSDVPMIHIYSRFTGEIISFHANLTEHQLAIILLRLDS